LFGIIGSALNLFLSKYICNSIKNVKKIFQMKNIKLIMFVAFGLNIVSVCCNSGDNNTISDSNNILIIKDEKSVLKMAFNSFSEENRTSSCTIISFQEIN
jgi:hypothetical protein